MDQRDNIEDLIAKDIAGETTPGEKRQLKEWRDVDPDHERYYQQSRTLFQTIDSFREEQPVDVGAAWQKLDSRIAGRGRVISLFSRKNILRAAASLIFFVSLGLLMYNVLTPENKTMALKADKSIHKADLPDGSTVVLNRKTELVFELTPAARKVKMSGEAYFEVRHEDAQPFIIDAGGVYIQDIGTAFNVKALPGSGFVEVTVQEGEVRFFASEKNAITLRAGDGALYNRSAAKIERIGREQLRNENAASYHTKQFNFAGSRLDEVVQQLNAVYDLKIELENKNIAGCLVSVQFSNERPEMILEILAETLDLKVQKQQDRIILSGEGCFSE